MTMLQIPAYAIDVAVGGNTLWVQSPKGGATTLRIQCSGVIKTHPGCNNLVPHADLRVEGDINLCMPEDNVPSSFVMVDASALAALLRAASLRSAPTLIVRQALVAAVQSSVVPM